MNTPCALIMEELNPQEHPPSSDESRTLGARGEHLAASQQIVGAPQTSVWRWNRPAIQHIFACLPALLHKSRARSGVESTGGVRCTESARQGHIYLIGTVHRRATRGAWYFQLLWAPSWIDRAPTFDGSAVHEATLCHNRICPFNVWTQTPGHQWTIGEVLFHDFNWDMRCGSGQGRVRLNGCDWCAKVVHPVGLPQSGDVVGPFQMNPRPRVMRAASQQSACTPGSF